MKFDKLNLIQFDEPSLKVSFMKFIKFDRGFVRLLQSIEY